MHLDDPVAVLVEGAGVEQLVLRVELAPPTVLGDEVVVGEGGLRVVVAPAVPAVAGHGVEVPPVLLDVLAVVGLRAGEPEHPLLQDGIPAVPQRQRQAQLLLDVREPGHPVLAPAVRTRAGVVVGEVGPGVAVGAVVLPDRAPLALAEVGAPQVPVAGLPQPVLELAEALDPRPLRSWHGSCSRRSRPIGRPHATNPGWARHPPVGMKPVGPRRAGATVDPVGQLSGEELQRGLGLGLLVAAQIDAVALQVGADVERRWRGHRRAPTSSDSSRMRLPSGYNQSSATIFPRV